MAWVHFPKFAKNQQGVFILEEGSGFGCSHGLSRDLAGGRILLLEARRLASDVGRGARPLPPQEVKSAAPRCAPTRSYRWLTS